MERISIFHEFEAKDQEKPIFPSIILKVLDPKESWGKSLFLPQQLGTVSSHSNFFRDQGKKSSPDFISVGIVVDLSNNLNRGYSTQHHIDFNVC